MFADIKQAKANLLFSCCFFSGPFIKVGATRMEKSLVVCSISFVLYYIFITTLPISVSVCLYGALCVCVWGFKQNQ